MFRSFLLFFWLFMLCVASFGHISEAQTTSGVTGTVFLSDLKFGDTSALVLKLQTLLNTDPVTRVAENGPGSPGNETYFFGPATRAAVIRFQNKHRTEILAPAGLAAGTGYVGAQTRLVLNKASTFGSTASSPAGTVEIGTGTSGAAAGVSAASDPLGQVTRLSQTDDSVTLTYPDVYATSPGSTITLFGSGFSLSANTVYVGSTSFTVAARNATSLAFKIPENFPNGRYDISLSNQKGTAPQKTFIVITDGRIPPPTIERIEPTSGSPRGTIRIVGKNFTPADNEVRTNFGIISGLFSGDGTTLSFSLNIPNAQEMETSLNRVSNLEWNVYMYVVNGNGVSSRNNPGVYTIKK